MWSCGEMKICCSGIKNRQSTPKDVFVESPTLELLEVVRVNPPEATLPFGCYLSFDEALV